MLVRINGLIWLLHGIVLICSFFNAIFLQFCGWTTKQILSSETKRTVFGVYRHFRNSRGWFCPRFFSFLSLLFDGEFRFSVWKPKVIAMSCHNKETISRNQGEVEVKTSKQPEAREDATEKVAVGFHFASDWSKVRREISKLITEQRLNRYNVEDYFPHFIQNCSYS